MYWNPNPDLFVIPYFNHPIKWYGFFFVIGFIIGYYLVLNPLRKFSENPQKLADKLLWYALGGTIIGARLGHVLFYEPHLYIQDPLAVLKIWEGGLASHGGVIGILAAIALFRYREKKNYPNLTYLKIIDLLTLPAALISFFIRIGNFFNQEIIGIPTNLPWAVTFGAPFDGSSIVPRHPSQLYEAFSYLILFGCLFALRNKPLKNGFRTGLLFFVIFSSRIIIEFTKQVQPAFIDQSTLQMGQWLSIPLVILGIYLMLRPVKNDFSSKVI
jgi:prolipoprotein diacylglyceryl transferase